MQIVAILNWSIFIGQQVLHSQCDGEVSRSRIRERRHFCKHVYLNCLCVHPLHPVVPYLALLVDDGHCILQLDVVEQASQENIGHTDQTVVLLFIEEWVGTLEIGPHHLQTHRKSKNGVRLKGPDHFLTCRPEHLMQLLFLLHQLSVITYCILQC